MYWNNTVETKSPTNHQIISDCFGQQWTISGTNLNVVWSSKKMHITEKPYTTDHKINTSSLQHFLRCHLLLSLSRYSPEFHGTYGSLQCILQCSLDAWLVKIHSDTDHYNPFQYHPPISTKAFWILFPSPFSIQKSVQEYIPSMHATFLTHFATVFFFIGTRWLMPRMYC